MYYDGNDINISIGAMILNYHTWLLQRHNKMYFLILKYHIFIASDIPTVKDKPNNTHFGISSSHSE